METLWWGRGALPQHPTRHPTRHLGGPQRLRDRFNVGAADIDPVPDSPYPVHSCASSAHGRRRSEVAETYEKRARKKRKEKKRRDKAEQKRIQSEQGPPEGVSEEDIAARYLDVPDEE